MAAKATIGAVLMAIGVLGFVPSVSSATDGLLAYALVPAILLLTLGTWMVGTDMSGRPV